MNISYIIALMALAYVCHIAAALQRFASLTGASNACLQYKGNAEQAADEIGTKEPLNRTGHEHCSG
jgi:predicted Zn-dependent protease